MFEAYTITVDTRIINLARHTGWPGWYIDVNGCYVCNLGKYLISIFVNNDTDELEVTVDGIDKETGLYTYNLEWEELPPDELAITARRFVVKYSNLL